MKLAIGLIGLWISVGISILTGGAILFLFILAADHESSSESSSEIDSVASSFVTASSFDESLDTEEEMFLELINQYRQEQGLATLVTRSELTATAFWKSWDTALENYFSHTDSQGRNPFQLMSAFGYLEWCWRGENLAGGYETAKSAFKAWERSPGHNANMLHPEFSEIGISRFADPAGDYGWYWATEFGGCSN